MVAPKQLLCSLPQPNVYFTQDFCTSSEMDKGIELTSGYFSHLDSPLLFFGEWACGMHKPDVFALRPLSKLSLWRHQMPESRFFPSGPPADFSKGSNCSSISFISFKMIALYFLLCLVP